MTRKLRLSVKQEDDWFIGQFLEHDVASQARTREGLIEEMKRIWWATCRSDREMGCDPYARLPPPVKVCMAATDVVEIEVDGPESVALEDVKAMKPEVAKAVDALLSSAKNLRRGCDCDYDVRCSMCSQLIKHMELAAQLEALIKQPV